MDLNRSSLIAEWPAKKALAAIQKKGSAGLEFLYTPAATTSQDVGPVIRLQGKGNKEYVRFSQKGKDLELEISTGNTQAVRLELANILHAHRPEHMYISLQEKQLKLYINGRLLKDVQLSKNSIPSWKNVSLLFGSPEGSGTGLNGTLSHVALYAGSTADREITKNSQLVTGALEARQDVETIRFKGELVEVSKVPAPEDLGAYQRALVVNRYRVPIVFP